MAEAFDKHVDYFNIRTVIARFEELESLKENRDDAKTAYEEEHADVAHASHGDGDPTGELNERLEKALEALKDVQDNFTPEEEEEYLILLSFLEEVKGRGGGRTMARRLVSCHVPSCGSFCRGDGGIGEG